MFYERTIGNIPAQEFWSSMEKIIEESIELCFLKYLPTLTSYIEAVSVNDDIVSTEQACKKLKYSRQTLNNWFKKEPTKSYLKDTLVKRGNKNFYKIAELKTILDNNPHLFSKGREETYKDANEVIETKSLNPILKKIRDKEISDLIDLEISEKVKMNKSLTFDEFRKLQKK